MSLSPLYTILERAEQPFTDIAGRILFYSTIHAGSCVYRIREVEAYPDSDPYTHRGHEQISTCGHWYFHRTRPGPDAAWKGGTYMGLDLSFDKIGNAGGLLIRGISRIRDENGSSTTHDKEVYFDGPCVCVRELLRACGVATIRELVDMPNFDGGDALSPTSILRIQESSRGVNPKGHNGFLRNGKPVLAYVATSRYGLSDPAKRPHDLAARKETHKAPLRFLNHPIMTKKEKGNINRAKTKYFAAITIDPSADAGDGAGLAGANAGRGDEMKTTGKRGAETLTSTSPKKKFGRA